jgi:uncharacterized damage-inducible protein DinB
MKKKNMTKAQKEEYDMIKKINPKWGDEKIFAQMEDNVLGEGFEYSEMAGRDKYPDNFRELINSMVGAKDKTEELKDDYEKELEEKDESFSIEKAINKIFGGSEEEGEEPTEIDKEEARLAEILGQSAHVSDADEGYMQDTLQGQLEYEAEQRKIQDQQELIEAMRRGEADRLAGAEQSFNNPNPNLAVQAPLNIGPMGAETGNPAMVQPINYQNPIANNQQMGMEQLQKMQQPDQEQILRAMQERSLASLRPTLMNPNYGIQNSRPGY